MEFSIKKLIASFLVLSAFTGGISILFHRSGLGASLGSLGEGNNINGGSALSDISDDPFGYDSVENAASSLSFNSSENVTEQLAQAVFERVMVKNPDGLQLNDEGEVIGNPADEEDINLVLENMEVQLAPEPISKEGLRITSSNDPKKIDRYFRDLAYVLLTTTGADRYKELIKQSPTPENLKEIESIFQSANKQLTELEIPEEAVKVHSRVLTFIRNRNAFLTSVAGYENDPARTLLVLQRQEELLKDDLKGFDVDLKNLHLSYLKANRNFSFWQNASREVSGLLTVPEAHAQQAVFDAISTALEGTELGELIGLVATNASELATTISSYTQDLLEWAQKIATEQLKNYLTKLFVQQVLTWTNNDGNQRFVYNWESFLLDVEEEVTSDAIDEYVPSLCGPFQAYVLKSQGYLGTQGRVKRSLRKSCPVSRNGRNMKNFYRDFSYGGWGDYFGTLEPAGNIYGAIMTADEYVGSRKKNALEKKTYELLANRGYLSQQKCEDGSEPRRGDVCEDGSTPRATTPGGLVGDTLGKAFGAPLERIVNANDLTDLTAALVNSAITGVLSSAQSKVNGVLGLGSGGIVDRSSERVEDVVCGGLTGSAQQNCLLDAGQSGSVLNNNQTTNATAEEARKIGGLWDAVEKASKDSLKIIEELTSIYKPGRFAGLLELVQYGDQRRQPRELFPEIPGCRQIYDPDDFRANPAIGEATHSAQRADRRAEVDTLWGQIPQLKTAIEGLNSQINYAKLRQDLSTVNANNMQSILDTYGTEAEVTLRKQVAEDRFAALADLKSKLEENLKATHYQTINDSNGRFQKPWDSACNVPLPIDVFVDGAPILTNPT